MENWGLRMENGEPNTEKLNRTKHVLGLNSAEYSNNASPIIPSLTRGASYF